MKTPETKQKEEFALAFRPRATETVSIEIPKDVLHSLKQVAANRDMSVQALLKSYIGQGARHRTSLMWAAQDGDLAMVRFLMAEGADIHIRDANGWTALMWAAQGGHLAVVKFLVASGADVDVNAQNNVGWTALMKAAMEGHLAVVRFLVDDHDADIHLKNKEGETALMRAAWGGHLAVVEFLVSKGGDIHAKDNRGWTALMKAAVSDRLAVVKFLVDLGAEVNAQNNSGETALTWAEAGDYQEMADFLRVARYIQLAMRRTTFEVLDDQTFYGEIVGFQGVYANAETLEQCREELQSVLEGWITLGLKMNHLLPEVDGVRLEGVPESV